MRALRQIRQQSLRPVRRGLTDQRAQSSSADGAARRLHAYAHKAAERREDVDNLSGDVEPQLTTQAPPKYYRFDHGQSSAIRPRSTSDDGANSIEIFRDMVQHQSVASPSAPRQRVQPSELLDLSTRLAALSDLLGSPTASAGDCFDYYVNECHPELMKRRGHHSAALPRHLKRALESKIIEAWKQHDSKDSPLPTVADITRVWRETGNFPPEQWASLMLGLLQAIVSMSRSPEAYGPVAQYGGAMERLSAMYWDSMRAWKVYFADLGRLGRPRGEAAAEIDAMPFKIPTFRAYRGKRQINPEKPASAFRVLFPREDGRDLHSVVLAIFASHVVWTDPSQQMPPAVSLALQPLLQITSGIMTQIRRSRDLLLDDGLFKEFPKLPQYLQAALDGASTASYNPPPGPHGPPPTAPRSKAPFVSLRSRLDDALKTKKAVTPAAMWADFKAAKMYVRGLTESDLKDCKSLLDRFGMVFMAFQQPDKSVEVWNAMRETNLEALQPDVRTFTAGIEGCKWARNLHGINELWKRLIDSGLSLDAYTWTERISGLITSGDIDAGLEALSELGEMWTHQRDKEEPWYIPPSIEPVNAALAGLLRARGLKAAQTLLAWAAERGITPDIFTYNLLLRPMLAAKMTDNVNRIFGMMKQQGVAANSATLTILLEGTLANYASQSEVEQGEVVNTMFEKLKIVGLEVNTVTMGKMIHTLLKARKRSDVAIKAVLAYMWAKGIELTPHISSMLVTHYFDLDPPDLNAIETLIRNRHLRDKQGIDHVFWEDIARGYARLNMIKPALEAFEKLESADAPVTLRTHEQLLSSIIRQPESVDRSTAVRIVEMAIRHAERRVGVVEAGKMDQRYMRHHFWQLAKEHGLLGQAEVDRLTAALKRPTT